MQIFKFEIPGILLVEDKKFYDSRGFFYEAYSQKKASDSGLKVKFVQDNISHSHKDVLRGLHYQIGRYAQSKLINVINGEIMDVAVDLRRKSPTFGKYVSVILS